MTFYKVKPGYDQTYIHKYLYSGHCMIVTCLIANELKTEKELKKIGIFPDSEAMECFEEVNISKFKTHWFFGTRYEDTKD